ncbi:MAG: hypothetical protein Q4F05_09145 [bacterium]|nr:hypothetical protein [bacterium]
MNLEHKQYLGILASEREVQGSPFREVALVNVNNEMQYTVKVLSKGDMPQQTFSGYINCFDEDSDIEENYYLDEEERIDNFLSEVEDKLFVFSYMQKAQKFYNINEAQLIPKPTSFDRTSRFISIPVFCAKEDSAVRVWESNNAVSLFREYDSYDEFVERIAKEFHVGRVIGFDMETSSLPPFVIWKEADGTLFAVNVIQGWDQAVNRGVILKGSQIDRYELSQYEDTIVYNEWVNPTLLFLPETVYQAIQDEMIVCKERYIPVVSAKPVVKKDPVEQKQEEQLLVTMKYQCQNMDLQYKESDLENFHTAVKCSDLVILSGMSGTGKSALVDVYAKTLGVSAQNKQLLFIPVCPSWNDDADLLGHIDLVNNVYHASDTGFVNLLIEAQKEENKDKLYLVCFDEMNLARVEHYFSQFLSILEKPSEGRSLILYDAQYSDKLENAKEYPYKIAIGDNIKFIGTVNVDESTYHFSDKVLDRANVITLDVMDYSQGYDEVLYEPLPERQWTVSEYRSMVSEYSRNQELRCFLWEIHTILQKANVKLGVGPRIVKCMEQYLSNLPEGESIKLTMDEAMDYQIVQRVLTKVRGPETQLASLLGNDLEAGILSVFDKYSHLSMFTKSRQVVEDKKKELEVYGYCV